MKPLAPRSQLSEPDCWVKLGWAIEQQLPAEIHSVGLKSIVPDIGSVVTSKPIRHMHFGKLDCWVCWHQFVGVRASRAARLTVFIGPVARFRARIRQEPLSARDLLRLPNQAVIETESGRWLIQTSDAGSLPLCKSVTLAFGNRSKRLKISDIGARAGWLCAVGPGTLSREVESRDYAISMDEAIRELANSLTSDMKLRVGPSIRDRRS